VSEPPRTAWSAIWDHQACLLETALDALSIARASASRAHKNRVENRPSTFYAEVLPEMASSCGVSKSNVSWEAAVAAEEALQELVERQFEEINLLVAQMSSLLKSFCSPYVNPGNIPVVVFDSAFEPLPCRHCVFSLYVSCRVSCASKLNQPDSTLLERAVCWLGWLGLRFDHPTPLNPLCPAPPAAAAVLGDRFLC